MSANQRPRLHVAPARHSTNGDLAADFAARYGLTPDPWQRLILDDWLAEDANGRYCALTCGIALSRQNGKNAAIEVRELFGMVGRGEAILHTAHQVKTARKAFKRLLHFFGRQVNDPGARFPELNALVTEMRHVNGQEAIYLSNGGSVEIVARSQGSGRGFTVDTLVMDEAQDLSDDDLEALMPATSSAPLGNPQWLFAGTPPGPKANGEVFTRTRAEALSGQAGRLCWHEWSVAGDDLDDIDLDDRALWFDSNPALGERLQIEVVEGERARFSDAGFARERLGWWQPGGTARADVLPGWALLADTAAVRGEQVTWGVDVNESRTATVSVVWKRPDGSWHAELGGPPLPAHALAARCLELTQRHGGEVAAPPVLFDDLIRAGVPAVEVRMADWPKACATVVDAVTAGTLRHGNQDPLNAAVAEVHLTAPNSAGVRAFSLKNSPDSGPLFAMTRALHAAAVEREADFYTL